MKFFNHILSLLGLRKNQQAAASEDAGGKPVGASPKQRHLFTLYRVGPSYLTYQYPVDTDPLKEIYEKDGKIGPARHSSDALKNMREYDNSWFFFNERENNLLMEELLILATKYKMYGAYSLLGSVATSHNQVLAFLKAGALKGRSECMVHYGMELYRDGKLDEGFSWLRKGADAGDDLGCLYAGISYNFGSLSEVDYEQAAEYYLKAIKAKETQYWAYVNLGVLLVQSGFYHTALRYFEKAKEGIAASYEDYNENRDADQLMSDYDSCLELLKYSYEERANWYVAQEHSSKLDNIFCHNHEAVGKLDERNFQKPKKWIPKAVIMNPYFKTPRKAKR